MFGDTRPNAGQWLVIDASQEGLLRFATADPSDHPTLQNVHQLDIADVPTFTDALEQYEQDSQLTLRGLQCAIAVAGPTTGETLSLVRSRWTITRGGMAARFGRPVTIMNAVAARAWAMRSGSVSVETLRGTGSLNLDCAGRYVMINAEEGVGAAVIDIDGAGEIRIMETEAGHMDFPPANEMEEKLAKAARKNAPHVSWENMLLTDRQSPLWAALCPRGTDGGHERILASILGRFAVNLMHAHGAWQGAMIAGKRGRELTDVGSRSAFEAAFGTARNFSSLVASAPAWLVDQREGVLIGAAQCLAHNLPAELRKAA